MSYFSYPTMSEFKRQHLTRLAIILSIVLPVAAFAQTEGVSKQEDIDEIASYEPSEDVLADLESRLQAEEYQVAIDTAKEFIDDIENNLSFYEQSLVKPLLIVGDGLRKLGNYVEALDAYDRAKHITRLNNGLVSIEQIEVVQREAETYYELGQIGRANDSYEYIFTVYNQVYEAFTPEILPSLFELGDWYVKIYNVFAARGLFEYAKNITDVHLDPHDPQRIRALRGVAATYRLEKFRPPSSLTHVNSDVPNLFWGDGRPYVYYAELNDFATGEKTLIELVKIELEREGSTRESQTRAKLALADWFVLFEKHDLARSVYSDIWEEYQEEPDSDLFTEIFDEPAILYNPLPRDPEPQPLNLDAQAIDASVTYSLEIDKRGRVRSIEVEVLQPDSKFIKTFNRQVSEAIFRPAFVNGKAVKRADVPFTHHYVFYQTEDSD